MIGTYFWSIGNLGQTEYLITMAVNTALAILGLFWDRKQER